MHRYACMHAPKIAIDARTYTTMRAETAMPNLAVGSLCPPGVPAAAFAPPVAEVLRTAVDNAIALHGQVRAVEPYRGPRMTRERIVRRERIRDSPGRTSTVGCYTMYMTIHSGSSVWTTNLFLYAA